MSKKEILRSQKNNILELIKFANLEPYNFQWKISKSRKTPNLDVSELRYVDWDFYFLFDFYKEGHYSIFSPGKDQIIGEEYPMRWENQKKYVSLWLTNLKREIEEPDLWQEISRYQISGEETIAAGQSNEPFTVPQVEQINKALSLIYDYIIGSVVIDKEQDEFVRERLDYLLDAAKRQGRRDWFHTCIGVVVTIVVALALNPDQTATIWQYLKSALSGVVKLLGS